MKGKDYNDVVVEQMIEKIRNDRSQRRSVYKRMMNKEIKKV